MGRPVAPATQNEGDAQRMSQPPWEWGAPHYRGGHDERPTDQRPPVCPGCRADLGSRTTLLDHHKHHTKALLDECSELVSVGTEGFGAGWACLLRALLRSPLVHRYLREGASARHVDTTLLRRVKNTRC